MKKRLVSAVIASMICASPIVSAQTQTTRSFLDIPTIKGDVVIKNFQEQIDVISWGWGLSNSSHPGFPGQGTTTFNAININKSGDSATSELIQALITEDILPLITLSVARQTANDILETFTEIQMSDTRIVGVQTGVTDGEVPIENISILFSKFCFRQNTIDNETGQLEFQKTPFCFDIRQNKEIDESDL